MDKVAIAELARQIVQDQVFENWKFYALVFAIWFLQLAASKFIGIYFGERGRIAGIEADFKTILSQLKETTAASKGVELALSHRDWVMKEFNTLRRLKLEELLSAVYDTSVWLEKLLSSEIVNVKLDATTSPVSKVNMLTVLYFPELATVCENMYLLHHRAYMLVIEASQDLSHIQERIEIVQYKISVLENGTPTPDSLVAYEELASDLLAARQVLSAKLKAHREIFVDTFSKFRAEIKECEAQSAQLMTHALASESRHSDCVDS